MVNLKHEYGILPRLGLISFFLFLCSCYQQKWPEDIDDLRSRYFDNQELFFELAELIVHSNHGEVFVSGRSEGVRVAIENEGMKSFQLITDQRSIEMNRLLMQLRLSSARILNDQIRFEVDQSTSKHDRQSLYYIGHSNTVVTTVDRCGDLESSPPDAGACYVALDQSWRIEFNWW